MDTRKTLIILTGILMQVVPISQARAESVLEGSPRLMRADCRFHNTEEIPGVGFCYASTIYLLGRSGALYDIHFGVGCDYQTVFDDMGSHIPVDTTKDRLIPRTAAIPALEVTPQGSLKMDGTYSSTLDLHLGRMAGHCYVRPFEPSSFENL